MGRDKTRTYPSRPMVISGDVNTGQVRLEQASGLSSVMTGTNSGSFPSHSPSKQDHPTKMGTAAHSWRENQRFWWFGHVCMVKVSRLPCSQRPTQWKVQQSAPKKTWTKQVENDLMDQRLDLKVARIIAFDRQSIVWNPAAPTAKYWFWCHPHSDGS